MRNKTITIIGAGNGGQAIAGYAAICGYDVCLYNRTLSNIDKIKDNKRIILTGVIENTGILSKVTDNLKEAIEFSDIIMVVTVANAHNELATEMAPFLRKNQIILLNPGRTGGVLEFKNIFQKLNVPFLYIAEAQTLIYACRLLDVGVVNIIGIKDKVLISSDTFYHTEFVIKKLSDLYTCFIPADNLLQTSLENIGAIFHPCVVMFNAAAIERGESFYFYRDMTPQIAEFIHKVDKERLEIGKAFGVSLISAEEWVSYAYPNISFGNGLCEKMKNNPAYYNIKAPSSIYTRQLFEDIPTGLVPMSELGKLANVNVKLIDSIITVCSALLNENFREKGRTLASLGLDNFTYTDIINYFRSNDAI
jgi:Glycerol-3-phosphate dehydrogenase